MNEQRFSTLPLILVTVTGDATYGNGNGTLLKIINFCFPPLLLLPKNVLRVCVCVRACV